MKLVYPDIPEGPFRKGWWTEGRSFLWSKMEKKELPPFPLMILVQKPLPLPMSPGPAHPRSGKSPIAPLHPLLSFLAVTTPFQIHEWSNGAGKGRHGEHKLGEMLQIS